MSATLTLIALTAIGLTVSPSLIDMPGEIVGHVAAEMPAPLQFLPFAGLSSSAPLDGSAAVDGAEPVFTMALDEPAPSPQATARGALEMVILTAPAPMPEAQPDPRVGLGAPGWGATSAELRAYPVMMIVDTCQAHLPIALILANVLLGAMLCSRRASRSAPQGEVVHAEAVAIDSKTWKEAEK